MRYNPHKYQEYSIEFIKNNPLCALFLDCGLGNTSITLFAILDMLKVGLINRVLVIAPLRVTNVWVQERDKWDELANLRISKVVGSAKEREQALSIAADIYVIGRDNLDWLVSKYYFDFDMVVIDELSSFKSYKSKRFKALNKVRHRVSRIVGLTGTPASNSLLDLWAEFRLLDGGARLGKYITEYRDKYFLPDKRNAQVIFSYKPREFAEPCIYKKIEDITISMKAKDYLKLPDLVENNIVVEMEKQEKKVYDELRKEMVAKVGEEEIDALNPAVLCGKLAQLSNGAIYKEDGGYQEFHDKKLNALEDLIEAQNGKPALVAYWFKHDLERIMQRFPNAKVINSNEDINAWNRGEIEIGLIQPQSVGMGVNLQEGGSVLIYYSLMWSLELFQQTNARLYRQNQKDTVVIHYIITKGTIDEDILKALRRKDKTQSALIDAVKARIKGGCEYE